MKKIISTVFILILLQSVICAEEKEKTDHIEKGKAHFKSGFYQLTPEHHQTEAKQQYVQAALEFKRAIALNPNNETAYRNLARVYAVQQHLEEAVVMYKKVIELNPWDVDTYVLAALALVELQQYDEAVQMLQATKVYTEDKAALFRIDGYILKIKAYHNAKEVPNVK